MKRTIYVGWDPREQTAYSIAMSSASRHLSEFVPMHGLFLGQMIDQGLYRRPIEYRDGGSGRKVMWDVISDAPMSTEHANCRFLVPRLAKTGWALFMDGDVLVRSDLMELFEGLDPKYAVYCVKHRHNPESAVKMDGQVQTRYARKNWTSVMAWNCDHPANAALTDEMINSLPGRDLHALCWLEDDLIGELGPEWNFLVGHSDPSIQPKIAHFTDGVPDMPGYENVDYAEEWRSELRRWAA